MTLRKVGIMILVQSVVPLFAQLIIWFVWKSLNLPMLFMAAIWGSIGSFFVIICKPGWESWECRKCRRGWSKRYPRESEKNRFGLRVRGRPADDLGIEAAHGH